MMVELEMELELVIEMEMLETSWHFLKLKE